MYRGNRGKKATCGFCPVLYKNTWTPQTRHASSYVHLKVHTRQRALLLTEMTNASESRHAENFSTTAFLRSLEDNKNIEVHCFGLQDDFNRLRGQSGGMIVSPAGFKSSRHELSRYITSTQSFSLLTFSAHLILIVPHSFAWPLPSVALPSTASSDKLVLPCLFTHRHFICFVPFGFAFTCYMLLFCFFFT